MGPRDPTQVVRFDGYPLSHLLGPGLFCFGGWFCLDVPFTLTPGLTNDFVLETGSHCAPLAVLVSGAHCVDQVDLNSY